jgi:serine/threonine protein kinase
LGNLNHRIYSEVSSITPSQALRFCWQIFCGLLYLHGNKIVHGDLKPENILLDSDDTLVLADFGLSASEHDGRLRGTFNYMAPELLLRTERGPKRNTCASDIYSVGVVMWELLSSKSPWHGKSEEDVRRRLTRGDNLLMDRTWAPLYQTWLPLMWRRIDDPAGERPTAKEMCDVLSSSLQSEHSLAQQEPSHLSNEEPHGASAASTVSGVNTTDLTRFSSSI